MQQPAAAGLILSATFGCWRIRILKLEYNYLTNFNPRITRRALAIQYIESNNLLIAIIMQLDLPLYFASSWSALIDGSNALFRSGALNKIITKHCNNSFVGIKNNEALL